MRLFIGPQSLHLAIGFKVLSNPAGEKPITLSPQLLGHTAAPRRQYSHAANTKLWQSACSSILPHNSFIALHRTSRRPHLPHHLGPSPPRAFSFIKRRLAGHQPPNPWAHPPLSEPEPPNLTSPRVASFVTKGLIAFCTGITLLHLYADAVLDLHTPRNPFRDNASYSTAKLCARIRQITQKYFIASTENERSNRAAHILGSTFMHASFLHIAVNMFVLNSFAPTVIMRYGLFRAFVPLWCIAGSAGSLASIRWQKVSESSDRWPSNDAVDSKSDSFLGIKPTPEIRAAYSGACGASGVLSGMLPFLWTAGYRGMSIGIPFVPLGIPLSVATVCFSAFEYWALSTGSVPAIDHAGHLGGAIAGAVFGVIFRIPFIRRPLF